MKTKLNVLLQKKTKWKRVSALVMVLFLLINNVVAPNVVKAASSTDRYEHSYSIEDLLTYFQYVTKADCTLVTHTVGPVAVGGTLSAKGVVVGHGAVTPSYTNILAGVTLPESGQENYGGTCKDFYYGSSDLSNQLLGGFTKNKDYMDLPGHFSSIETASNALVNGAVMATIDADAIVCDLTQNTNYTIAFSDLYAAKKINLILDDVNKIKTNKYIINITGMNVQDAASFLFDSTSSMGAKNSTRIDVLFNGVAEPYLKKMSGAIKPNECNVSGMKLIFNFPDATGDLIVNNFGGHIVAPKATVKPIGGNLEGGVIAKTVFTTMTDGASAEAHYFPYNTPVGNSNTGNEDEPEPVSCDDIELIKKYVSSTGGAIVPTNELPAVGAGAKFTLFKDGVPVKGAENVEPVKDNNEYRLNIVGDLLAPNTLYVLKETTPALGFEINATEYYCRLDANGDITYNNNVVDNGYSQIIPVCENVKSATQEIAKGTLKVTVKEKNSSTMIKDVSVKITGPNGYTNTVKTDADGTVIVSDLTIGIYTVEIPNKIGNYQTLVANTQPAIVNENKQAEVLFELEKPAPTGNLTIEVKDNQNNQLVPGAKVTVTYPDNSTKVHTATNGKIELTGVPVGKYAAEIKELPAGYKEATVKTDDTTVVENQTANMVLKVDKVGSLKVIVKEENSSTKVGNVTVKITGTNYSKDFKTTTADDILVKDLPVGNYTVTISKENAGYVTLTDVEAKKTDSVKANNTTEYIFELKKETPKTGNLTIEVKDNQNNQLVPGAKVTVTYPDNSTKVHTATNGKIELTGVPVGKYTAEIKELPAGYKEATVKTDDATVVENQTANMLLKVDKVGSLKVIVKEKDSTTKVGNVKVTITGPNNYRQDITTTTSKDIEVKDLPIGNYTVTISKENAGYVTLTAAQAQKEDVVKENLTTEYVFELEKEPAATGDLTIKVTDEQTGKPVPGATVVVTYPDGTKETHTTDNNGEIKLPDVPTGTYTTEITEVPDGYNVTTDEEKTVTVNKDDDKTIEYKVDKVGSLKVIVKEKDSTTKVGNVKVTITGPNNYRQETTTSTSQDIEVKDLPIGNYTVTISKENAGYVTLTAAQAQKADAVKENLTTEYVFELEKDPTAIGNLTIKVTDEQTGKPVPGATVVVTYPDGTKETHTTDDNGEIKLPNVPAGSYTTEITGVPDGYNVTTDEEKTVVVNKGDDKSIEYKVDKPNPQPGKGNLTITVTDEKTGAPVPGAIVKVTDPSGKTTEYTTDANGQIKLTNVPAGEYTTEITKVPAGYTVTTNTKTTATVEVNKTAQAEYKVGKTASTTDIPKDDQTYDDPKDSDDDEDDEDEDDKLGNLTITVEDEITGDPVPNATVKVTYPNGKSKTYKSNEDGEIELEDVPAGNYQIEVTEVPDGYTVTLNKKSTAKVKKGDTTEKVIKVKTSDANTNTNTNTTSGTSVKPSPKPSTPAKVTSSQPKTGDDMNPMFFLVLFLASAFALLLSIFGLKRANRRERERQVTFKRQF